MSNFQQSSLSSPFPILRWRAPASGELVARDQSLWLTRRGDLDDHVLEPGQRLRLRSGDEVVIEALRRTAPPAWDWHPAESGHPGGGIQPSRRPAALRRLAGWAAGLLRPAGAGARATGLEGCAAPRA
jgi:hypothetical protein